MEELEAFGVTNFPIIEAGEYYNSRIPRNDTDLVTNRSLGSQGYRLKQNSEIKMKLSVKHD